MMSSYWQTKQGQRITLTAILIGSACLLFGNLANQNLWQDEAQTALISKTILTEGVPRGYDGKNYFSQEFGAEYGNNYIWRWHTWLPFYVLAGFYKIFGVSTFISRLPFVLFGLGTIVLLYYYARAVWPNTRIPVIAASLLAISVPFLILSRQCRYYSMVMFFTLLCLYAYVLLQQNRKHAAILLFVAITLLFHSQHIYVTVFPALFLHALIFRRDLLKKLAKVTLLAVLINIPWVIWFYGMKYRSTYQQIASLRPLTFFIQNYLKDLVEYVFPLWLFTGLPVWYFAIRFRTGRFPIPSWQALERVSLPLLFILFNIIAVSATSPAPFFRYVAPSVVLLILLAAVIIDALWQAHLIFAAVALIVMVATSQMNDYLYEITHDFKGPEKGIAKYLNEHGSPDDIVAITYGDMGIKFYTKMRVVGGLTGEDLSPAKNARWVIFRKYILSDKDWQVAKYLKENLPFNQYRAIQIDYPDTAFENRESLDAHMFRTDTEKPNVVIFEKITP